MFDMLMHAEASMRLSRLLAEDVSAPELRNPRHSGMFPLRRLFGLLRRR